MPMSTYLDGDRHTKPTVDKELNAVLAEVRAATGEDWRVGEHAVESFIPFRGTRIKRTYTLYHHVVGNEFQVLNLRGTTIGTVEAFLFGVLAGIQSVSEAVSERHEKEMLEVIDERDRAEDWADKLAHAIGGDVIGEHSSTNNPWKNALRIAELEAFIGTSHNASRPRTKIEQDNTRLALENARLSDERDRLAQRVKELEADLRVSEVALGFFEGTQTPREYQLEQENAKLNERVKELEEVKSRDHYYELLRENARLKAELAAVKEQHLEILESDPRESGCLCQRCGQRYKVDLNLPNDIWSSISGGHNLLCGLCIAKSIESLGAFDSLDIRRTP